MIDKQGNCIFLFQDEGQNQTIKLNPIFLQNTDVFKWHLVGLLFSDALMSNIKAASADMAPDIRAAIDELIKRAFVDVERTRMSGPNSDDTTADACPSDFYRKVKLKYYSKKVGHKIYGSGSKGTAILDTITSSIYYEEKLLVNYASHKGASKFKVSPYTLLEFKGALYILGPHGTMKEPRLVAIDRIIDVKRLKGERFR
ncbi:MAG: WYL domain-containing protein, partial [Oligoflexia bacterium]|nr:WYL domain-containing protein [Oligoflexia bacterium]